MKKEDDMSRKLLFFTFAATIFLIFSSGSFAQEPTPAVGDYGSVASGNWSALSTWKQWDGSGWNTTPTGGPGSSKQVFILTGTTVTYDVNSQNCKSLIVRSGAILKSDSTLPCPSSSLMALKINGPTVWVDGQLGSGPNDALVLETKYDGTVTLAGSGKVNLAQVRPNSGQSGTMAFVFAMNANINYAGPDGSGGAGIYTQRGTQTSSTITVNAGDTVDFAANSSFMINPTAGLNGLMNNTLNVNGVINDSGTVVLADSSTATAALNIGSAGKLVIRGSSLVQSLNGGNTATVTVDGTYEHAMDGGVIPTATWNTGSTCLVTGTTTLAPTNANQNFYNLTVDCPGLTQPSYPCHFDMASNTIAGNVTFKNTNGSYYALTGYEVPGSPKTITVEGDFSVDSTSALVAVDDYSSSHPVESVKLLVKGNFSSRGSFGLTVGSAHNLVDLILHRNLTLKAGSSFFAHSKTQDSLFFAGTGVQTYTAGALSNGNYVNTLVQSGTTLQMDTSAFQGSSSTFTVESVATLSTSHPLGLNGNITVGAGTSLSSEANYVYDGTGPQVTGSLLPDTVNGLTIGSLAIDTLSSRMSVFDTLLVNGHLVNSVGIDSARVMVVNGTYEHAINGGAIPTATWNTGSTCLVTGSTSLGPTNANQNFYNLTVDCPGLLQPSYPCHFDMRDNTIMGNLTFHDTHGNFFALTGYEVPGSPKTITVNGNFSLDSTSDSVSVDDYSSSHPVESVNLHVKGNMLNAGFFALTYGSASNLINLFLYGNLTIHGGSSFCAHSKTQDSLFFAGTGVQSYIAGPGGAANRAHVNYAVLTGSTLDMDTSAFEGGSSSFTLDSGATVKTAHPSGLNGNLTLGGGRSLSTHSGYEFDGESAQVTGSFLPSEVHNLTVNNAHGVTLSDTLGVNGVFNLSKGVLYVGKNTLAAASVIGGSSTSYVSTDSAASYLKIPDVGKTQVKFPVGTAAEGYSPLWITNAGTADTYTVSASRDTVTVNGGGRVDVRWNIGEGTQGGSSLTLQFGWMAPSENSAFSSDRSANARIYLLSDTGNTEAGSGNYATQFSSQPYTVSRGGITSVGAFGVGNFSTTGVNEAENVPIEFKLYQNYPNPFNPSTKIQFTVEKKGMTSITVYNILGQKVATLFSGEAQPGKKYRAEFNGASLASGVYFSVLQSGGQRQVQKMILMK